MTTPLGPSWAEDDRESLGEGIPRCTRAGCHSPLELYVADTLILERCQQSHHVQHLQLVFPEAFADG